jgi:hypothetical protein
LVLRSAGEDMPFEPLNQILFPYMTRLLILLTSVARTLIARLK